MRSLRKRASPKASPRASLRASLKASLRASLRASLKASLKEGLRASRTASLQTIKSLQRQSRIRKMPRSRKRESGLARQPSTVRAPAADRLLQPQQRRTSEVGAAIDHPVPRQETRRSEIPPGKTLDEARPQRGAETETTGIRIGTHTGVVIGLRLGPGDLWMMLRIQGTPGHQDVIAAAAVTVGLEDREADQPGGEEVGPREGTIGGHLAAPHDLVVIITALTEDPDRLADGALTEQLDVRDHGL